MKRRFVVLIIVVCVLVGITTTAFADEPPAVVQKAASDGLPAWLNRVAASPPEHFGLTDSSQVKRAVLGTPLEIYSIETEKLLAYKGSTPVRSLLSKANRWLYPVLADGKVRFFYEVALLENGQAVGVGVGDAELAQDVGEMAAQAPALLRARGVADNGTTLFVRVLDQYTFLLVDSPAGEFVMAPEWARLFWEYAPNELADPAPFITRLAERERERLAHPDLDIGLSDKATGNTASKPPAAPSQRMDVSPSTQVLVGALGLLAAAAAMVGVLIRRKQAKSLAKRGR